ncbi:MFS transporter [Nocardioides terrisoli]|uniref:MFS transporter n=1 Tax=Nocardioides terrisoli TaxID=3388267 RepID=UPI00287BB853|nr:MFS transporter [Nocardioides marmorisolisilvae]
MRGWRRALPPPGLARRLSLLSGLYAIGSGVFLAGNAVFFTQVVGLSPAKVGLGLSIAGVAAFVVSVPAGRLADRHGVRGVWAAGCLVEGLLYLAYPWVRGFGPFVAMVVALAVAVAAGSAGRGGYSLAAIPRGERVRVLAFVRSFLNIGFTGGALISGLALGLGDRDVIELLPLVTGAVLVCTAALIRRLPRPDRLMPEPEVVVPARVDGHADGHSVMRNRAFVGLSMLNGQLSVNQVLLVVVLPLWLVEATDAPRAALAWLYGTNTVLAVLLQVPTARGSETLAGALRAARVAALAVTAACGLAMATHWTHGWPTVAVLWCAYVAVTAAELYSSASSWGMLSELTDPARRAEYQGAWRLGTQFQTMAGPALCTWLAVTWSPFGFLVIAGIAVAAALGMPPLIAAARRTAGEDAAAGRLPELESTVDPVTTEAGGAGIGTTEPRAEKPTGTLPASADTIGGSPSDPPIRGVPSCPTYPSRSSPPPATPSAR